MHEPLITTGTLSLCSVLLALIVVLLNHGFSKTRDRRKIRLEKGQSLIEAYRPELDALIHNTNDDPRLILTPEAYRRHESAIRYFTPYLSWIDRLRIRWAWHRLAYHPRDKDGKIPFYEQYADCGSLNKRKSVRPVVIARIKRIISFAQK